MKRHLTNVIPNSKCDWNTFVLEPKLLILDQSTAESIIGSNKLNARYYDRLTKNGRELTAQYERADFDENEQRTATVHIFNDVYFTVLCGSLGYPPASKN